MPTPSLLRRARDADASLFYELRNDPEVRKLSGHADEIEPDEHFWWWYMVPEHRFVIGRSEGYVRVSMDGSVSIALRSHARGRGRGTKALVELPTQVNIPVLSAVCLYENIGSQQAFLSAGWRPVKFEWRKG